MEDSESNTSDMDASHLCLPLGYSGTDLSGLHLKGRTDLEEGDISYHSSLPEPMDQANTLGHEKYSAGGVASDNGAAFGRISDFQSEDLDTTAQPSEVESYSDRAMTSQDALYTHSGPDSDWDDGESEASKRCRMYPKILPHLISTADQVQNQWHREEDLMDPRRVASPAGRVGRPNTDGSIGGDKGHPLPPKRPDRNTFMKKGR